MMTIRPTLTKAARAVRAALAGAAVGAMLITSPAPAVASGIPTVDVAAIAQMIQQLLIMMQQYEQLVNQLEQLKTNYRQLQDTHNNFTGNRGFGGFQTDLAQYAFVARDIDRTLDRIDRFGASALDATSAALYQKHGMGDACANMRTSSLRASCERKAALRAFQMATWGTSYSSSLSHIDTIGNLYDRITQTTDAKGIMEVQARIQNEQNALQTEQARLDALEKMMLAQTRVEEVREQAAFAKEAAPNDAFRNQYLRLD